MAVLHHSRYLNSAYAITETSKKVQKFKFKSDMNTIINDNLNYASIFDWTFKALSILIPIIIGLWLYHRQKRIETLVEKQSDSKRSLSKHRFEEVSRVVADLIFAQEFLTTTKGFYRMEKSGQLITIDRSRFERARHIIFSFENEKKTALHLLLDSRTNLLIIRFYDCLEEAWYGWHAYSVFRIDDYEDRATGKRLLYKKIKQHIRESYTIRKKLTSTLKDILGKA